MTAWRQWENVAKDAHKMKCKQQTIKAGRGRRREAKKKNSSTNGSNRTTRDNNCVSLSRFSLNEAREWPKEKNAQNYSSVLSAKTRYGCTRHRRKSNAFRTWEFAVWLVCIWVDNESMHLRAHNFWFIVCCIVCQMQWWSNRQFAIIFSRLIKITYAYWRQTKMMMKTEMAAKKWINYYRIIIAANEKKCSLFFPIWKFSHSASPNKRRWQRWPRIRFYLSTWVPY